MFSQVCVFSSISCVIGVPHWILGNVGLRIIRIPVYTCILVVYYSENIILEQSPRLTDSVTWENEVFYWYFSRWEQICVLTLHLVAYIAKNSEVYYTWFASNERAGVPDKSTSVWARMREIMARFVWTGGNTILFEPRKLTGQCVYYIMCDTFLRLIELIDLPNIRCIYRLLSSLVIGYFFKWFAEALERFRSSSRYIGVTLRKICCGKPRFGGSQNIVAISWITPGIKTKRLTDERRNRDERRAQIVHRGDRDLKVNFRGTTKVGQPSVRARQDDPSVISFSLHRILSRFLTFAVASCCKFVLFPHPLLPAAGWLCTLENISKCYAYCRMIVKWKSTVAHRE